MHGRAFKQYIFRSCDTFTFNAMRFDKKKKKKILSHASAKKKKRKGLKVSNFALLMVVFKDTIILVDQLYASLQIIIHSSHTVKYSV